MSEQLQFDKTVHKIESLFHFVGIHIKSGENNIDERKPFLFIYIVNHILLNYLIFGAIYFLIDGIMKGQDFMSLTFMAPCIALGFLTISKSLSLIYHGKTVEQLMGNLRQLEREENSRIKNVEKDKIIETDLKFLNIVIKSLNIVYGLLVFTFAFSPLVLIGLNYYQTKELELVLTFQIKYPLDSYNIIYYPIMFIHQGWSELVSVLEIASADHFFFICCSYIRMHFRLLQYDFERIIETRKISQGPFHKNEVFNAKFASLVMRHQKLIESANMIETIFSMSTLVNFLTSSVIICLTGFNVTMMNDKTLIVQFVSFLFMSLMQIFFLCFFADLLSASSTDLSTAIYNCNWYLADASIGKQLLIVLTRAQKPCKLTAVGFADVNLNSFMRVLSTAWSYFALIRTMYGTN